MSRLIDADALAKVLNDFWLATSPREHDDKETALERAAMCRGIDDCIKHVHDSPTIGGWISVKDRLPEKTERYMCLCYDFVTKSYWYELLWYENNHWWNSLATLEYNYTKHVVYWMPFPELPKEESDV